MGVGKNLLIEDGVGLPTLNSRELGFNPGIPIISIPRPTLTSSLDSRD